LTLSHTRREVAPPATSDDINVVVPKKNPVPVQVSLALLEIGAEIGVSQMQVSRLLRRILLVLISALIVRVRTLAVSP
jgi:hypothetical protein